MKRGFTLVEVMISVALVLVLIVGVNQVFKITADTVSAGQVMSANVRDARAVQGVLYSDIGAAINEPPMFMLASSRVSAFRNADDRATDRDYPVAATIADKEAAIRTIDINGDNGENNPPAFGELISPATYNFRSHRIDRMGFFARGRFARQTGNAGTFASANGASEAWIWYGHLRLANNSATPGYFQPGQFDTTVRNDNNALGSQFALGRMVMLLRDPNSLPTPPPGQTQDRFIQRDPAFVPPPAVMAPNPKLTPLSWESESADEFALWDSRYDLAGTTIEQFEADLEAVAPGQSHWWQRFVYAVSAGAAVATPPDIGVAPVDFRYRASRFFTKPLDSEKASLLAPILLDGCSQFIVEYAGNYVTQDDDPTAATYGDVTAITPDLSGTIDYVVDNSSGSPVRRVRWYGMPRDVAGNAKGGPDGRIFSGSIASPSVDVVPLRDVRGVPTTFERNVTQEMPTKTDYLEADGMLPIARYTCVWGPDVNLINDPLPKMLRITVVLDDLNGRLAEGQAYEYVVTLPY